MLALGKLGGGELNFSSDVDLVYVHRERLRGAEPRAQALGRQLTAVLAGEPTDEGHVYRVDLRLRPEGRAGSISHSLEAAAEYYGRRGATWERLALLKARPVAGDRGARARAAAPGRAVRVAASRSDPDAVAEVLRHKRESDRRLAARQLENRHVKLGRGGIREIELVAQVLQIRAGGRLRQPRARGTLGALEALRGARRARRRRSTAGSREPTCSCATWRTSCRWRTTPRPTCSPTTSTASRCWRRGWATGAARGDGGRRALQARSPRATRTRCAALFERLLGRLLTSRSAP